MKKLVKIKITVTTIYFGVKIVKFKMFRRQKLKFTDQVEVKICVWHAVFKLKKVKIKQNCK